MKIDFIQNLFENSDPVRIPHPEDSIFDGSHAAQRYLDGLKEVIANPEKVTIKWDGGIALFFGTTPNGEFFCSDKYMYPKGVLAKSPEEWVESDKVNRRAGATRGDLYEKIKLIWPGLQAAVGNTQGVFKGDLLSTGKLTPQNGMFTFSPTTVEYRIPVKSKIGQLIAGKSAIIAVHQYNNQPWDGHTGLTNTGTNIAILSPTAGIKFGLDTYDRSLELLVKNADTVLAQHAEQADAFLAGLSAPAKASIKTYYNKKITGQTNEELGQWLADKANSSSKQYKLVVTDGYLQQHEDEYEALRAIWNAIYFLKEKLASKFEEQIKGFEQWTGNNQEGEGFVFTSDNAGPIKLVNRGVFGKAHFN